MEDLHAGYTHTPWCHSQPDAERQFLCPGRADRLGRLVRCGNRKQSSLGRPTRHARHFLTGPVAYAISVIAIVALGATLAFASGEMGETMKRLLQIGIAVCLVVFAAQVMSSFIGQAAEVSLLQPVHAVAQPALRLVARG